MSPQAAEPPAEPGVAGWPPLQPAFAGDAQIVARATDAACSIAPLAERIERERRLPEELLERLHALRLFRLLLPRSVDGEEVDPITFFHVIETVARADASAAWCLSQAGGCAMAAAYLAPAAAHEVFGTDPRAVLAWGPGPKVRAVRVPGGYRVSGEWSFASGGRHATWLGAHCPVVDAKGDPLRDTGGRRVERTMLVRASDVAWTDIWDTVGLRGTASDRFALDDHFVPEALSITRDFTRERCESGPLYRMSANTCYQIGFAGVALGIARGALDDFVALARDKVPRGQRSTLRDNAVVQSTLAQAEAGVRAARSWLLQTVDEIWQTLGRTQTPLGEAQRIAIRMVSTHGIHRAREAVDAVWNASGATAIFHSHPLERRFRDIHTVTQQLQGRMAHFETVGAWMLGADADLTFV